jgi:hypothetical protein
MSKFLASFVKLTDSVKVRNEPTGLSSSKWMGNLRYHMLANAQKHCAAPPCVSYYTEPWLLQWLPPPELSAMVIETESYHE